MAVDILVDSGKLDACCEAEAAAIIAKGGGTAPLAYDFANNKGFADAIAAIPTGGSSVFKESGEIAVHTGANTYTLSIPVSDDTKAHYFVLVKAKNAWLKVDGVWTEREGLDFSGYTSAGQVLCIAATALYPKILTNSTKHDETVTEGLARNSMLYAKGVANTGAISWSTASSHTITVADGVLSLYSSETAFCRLPIGLTHEYTVIGWD